MPNIISLLRKPTFLIGLGAVVFLNSASALSAPILFTQTIVVNTLLDFTLSLTGNGFTPNAIDAVTRTNALSLGAGAVWEVDYTVEGTADGAGFLNSVTVEGEVTHLGFTRAPDHLHAGVTGDTFDFDLTIRAGNAAPNLRIGRFAGNPEEHHLDHKDIFNVGLRGTTNVARTRLLTWDLTLIGHHDLPNEIAEPATFTCLGLGVAGLAFWRRRRGGSKASRGLLTSYASDRASSMLKAARVFVDVLDARPS